MKRVVKYRNRRRFRRFLVVLSILIMAAALFACELYVQDRESRIDSSDKQSTLENPQNNQNTKEIIEEIKNDIPVEPRAIPRGNRPIDFEDYNWEVIENGKLVNNFLRQPSISFSDPDSYSLVQGITTFRGNNYRNSASYGRANVMEKKLTPTWFSKTGYIDTWTGVGWNGQPAIVRWDDQVKNIMNIFPDKKSKSNLIEVVYGTLDGKIYFLDIDDGKPTRNPIDIGYPIKGSVAIDSRGYPLLYVGQGVPDKGGQYGPIGYRIFSLIDQKQLYFIDGMDPDAYRKWGAFDAVPLIDSATDTLIECGENGIIYTIKLNTVFSIDRADISIKPETVKYRYTSPYGTKIGAENSPAAYKSFIYFADNSGLFQCLDINKMQPVWARYVTDDTDSTTVLEDEGASGVSLYTACEVDLQGPGGLSYMRKLNALTGELLWEKSIKCVYDSNTNGGALATPVVGKHEIDNLVIFNIGRTGNKGYGGSLFAFDKESGSEVWRVNLDYYSWSSPVDIYTESGKAYLVVCDSGGYMRLLDGKTGKEYHSIPLEANIEASPAVYNNTIVVGTRGQKIWGIEIK